MDVWAIKEPHTKHGKLGKNKAHLSKSYREYLQKKHLTTTLENYFTQNELLQKKHRTTTSI